MMRLLTVTIKDLIQSSRALSLYMFMFVIPILVTLLFFIMFGNASGEDEGFELPTTAVVIVNLDEGRLPIEQFVDIDMDQVTSVDLDDARNMGDVLAGIIGSELFADLITYSEAAGESEAMVAVDNQEAGVAIIIPADFTEAITGELETTRIQLYKDPTLTFGPSIVESIVTQIVDGFSANKITISVTMEQLLAAGIPLTQELPAQLFEQFSASSSTQGSSAPITLIDSRLPAGLEQTNLIVEIVSLIFSGMMVFFAFFTGAASMETVLVEEEKGTLSRLFTTPNSHRTILGGKGLASVVTLVIQVTVLMAFGYLVFNIDWGDPLPMLMAALGLIMVAAATGLFLVSLLDNTRQGGIVFGGVLTITGMLGLIPVFTAGVPNQSESVKLVSLLVPQGWAIRGITTALEGGSALDVLPILGVLFVWSLVFAFIGQHRLQRRFS